MDHCETCKFWGVEDARESRLRDCSRWHQGYTVSQDEVADNEAWVENDEGWAMALGPKFGCVLHEPNDDALVTTPSKL